MEQYNCGAELRKEPGGRYQMTVPPVDYGAGALRTAVGRGLPEISADPRGYKYPVRVTQLAELRRFNEELRTALGVPTYYNEALGSTCQYSVYDRVKGRAGDVPDESVGAREEAEH